MPVLDPDEQELVDRAALAALPILLSHDFDDTHRAVCERAYHVGLAFLKERKRLEEVAEAEASAAKSAKKAS